MPEEIFDGNDANRINQEIESLARSIMEQLGMNRSADENVLFTQAEVTLYNFAQTILREKRPGTNPEIVREGLRQKLSERLRALKKERDEMAASLRAQPEEGFVASSKRGGILGWFRRGREGAKHMAARLQQQASGGARRPPTGPGYPTRRAEAERPTRGPNIDELMSASETSRRENYPPSGGSGGFRGRSGGGEGGSRGGSYYEDDIKASRAAKKAFFEGDIERAVEILREIGWDDGKIKKTLGKWKREYEVVEAAEKAYFERDERKAIKMLKSELKWNNEKIRQALERWRSQSTHGRMMVETRPDQEVGGVPVAKYLPRELAQKYNVSKLSKPSPRLQAIIDELEEIWEDTMEGNG